MPRNTNKDRIISQDNDSISLLADSDVEDESKGDQDDTLRWVMLVNETEQPETGVRTSNEHILRDLTESLKNDELFDLVINSNLANAMNDV